MCRGLVVLWPGAGDEEVAQKIRATGMTGTCLDHKDINCTTRTTKRKKGKNKQTILWYVKWLRAPYIYSHTKCLFETLN